MRKDEKIREAARALVERLDKFGIVPMRWSNDHAIDALRAALALPEDEGVESRSVVEAAYDAGYEDREPISQMFTPEIRRRMSVDRVLAEASPTGVYTAPTVSESPSPDGTAQVDSRRDAYPKDGASKGSSGGGSTSTPAPGKKVRPTRKCLRAAGWTSCMTADEPFRCLWGDPVGGGWYEESDALRLHEQRTTTPTPAPSGQPGTDTPARPAPSAESVREACAEIARNLARQARAASNEHGEKDIEEAEAAEAIDIAAASMAETIERRIRSLPLPPASKVERAREAVVEKAKAWRSDPSRVWAKCQSDADLMEAIDVLIAAEDEANKGGSRGD